MPKKLFWRFPPIFTEKRHSRTDPTVSERWGQRWNSSSGKYIPRKHSSNHSCILWLDATLTVISLCLNSSSDQCKVGPFICSEIWKKIMQKKILTCISFWCFWKRKHPCEHSCPSDGRLVGRSVTISWKCGKLHFNVPIGALVIF